MNRATGLDTSPMGIPVIMDTFIDTCLFIRQGADECARLLLAKLQNRIQSEKVSRFYLLVFWLTIHNKSSLVLESNSATSTTFTQKS
jgi:hypothetical protein